MSTLDALLAAIVSDPREDTRWLVLADWLEENDQPDRAELLRLHRKLIATCLEPDAHPERAGWQARMVELLVAGVRPCVPQETLTLPGGVPMTFSFIPPGAFLMGSAKGQYDKPVHRVELKKGFFCGIGPVTQAQWFAVMGTDPSRFKGSRRPVEQVSRDDCRIFCATLSTATGRAIELPTSAEWECACRAGTTTEFHFGNALNPSLATFTERDEHTLLAAPNAPHEQTTDVGSHPPNAWGLFDVHGNVWEWCADQYGPHPGSEFDPYRGFALGIARGGDWNAGGNSCGAANRLPIHGSVRDYADCGFRVVMRPD